MLAQAGCSLARARQQRVEFGVPDQESVLRMAEASPSPAGSPLIPASAASWLSYRPLPGTVPQAPSSGNLLLNPDGSGCSFVPFTQTVPVQVDMAMALHRVRIAEKYGKNYLCLLQAVFLAGEYHFPVHSHPAAWDTQLSPLPGSLPSLLQGGCTLSSPCSQCLGVCRTLLLFPSPLHSISPYSRLWCSSMEPSILWSSFSC